MVDKELDALIPEEVYVSVKGEQLQVKPFNFLNLLKVLKILFSMTESVSLDLMDQYSTIKMVADHPDEVLRIFSYSTGKPVNFFDDSVTADEGAELVAQIYLVNQDFFVQKLRPRLEKLNESSSLLESQTVTSEQLLTNEEGQESKPLTTSEDGMSQQTATV